MPIVAKLMDALTSRYGPEEGKRVYYAMEAEGKGPFSEGGKYRHLHEDFARRHGVAPVTSKKKPRRSGGPKRRG